MNKEKNENVSRETLHKILSITLEKYGIFVSEDLAKKAFGFWEELVFWNKTHNLTTVTEFHESALVHFADSLVVNDLDFYYPTEIPGRNAEEDPVPDEILKYPLCPSK